VWRYTGNKSAKFHGNILSLSENIAKSVLGGGGNFFLTHTVQVRVLEARPTLSATKMYRPKNPALLSAMYGKDSLQ